MWEGDLQLELLTHAPFYPHSLPISPESPGEVIHLPLGLHKYDSLVLWLPHDGLQQLKQPVLLLIVLTDMYILSDVVVGTQVQAPYVYLDVVHQKVFSQTWMEMK